MIRFAKFINTVAIAINPKSSGNNIRVRITDTINPIP
jgi:hypothetical protein